MKKTLLCIFTILLAIALLTACSKPAQQPEAQSPANEPATTAPATDEGKRPLIGYANLGDTMQFAMDVQNSCIEQAEIYGADIICLDNNFDAQKAIENTSALILQGVDGIIMFNTDESTNTTVKEMCDEAGIPAIAVEIEMPNTPFMGADNFMSGFLVGQELGKYANELWDGQVDFLLLVELPRSGKSTQERMDSIITGVQDQIPDFVETADTVIRVDGENDVLPAQQRTAEVLTAHPDAKHILIGTLNDSNGLGSLNAVQAAGRDSDCLIVAHGCSTPMQTNLWADEDNCWKAGVGYFPETYGEHLIPAMLDLIAGKTIPDQLHPVHQVVDKSNIEEFYPNPNK